MGFQLHNNKVWTFPLKCQTTAGVAGSFTSNPVATPSNPASLGAVVSLANGGAGPGFSMALTPKVQVSPGLTVTVTAPGMTPAVFAVDIVADPDMLSVVVDTTTTTTPQNVPFAPGP